MMTVEWRPGDTVKVLQLRVRCQACGNCALIEPNSLPVWAASHHLPRADAALLALAGNSPEWVAIRLVS